MVYLLEHDLNKESERWVPATNCSNMLLFFHRWWPCSVYTITLPLFTTIPCKVTAICCMLVISISPVVRIQISIQKVLCNVDSKPHPQMDSIQIGIGLEVASAVYILCNWTLINPDTVHSELAVKMDFTFLGRHFE
jgi:hypothetical protein